MAVHELQEEFRSIHEQLVPTHEEVAPTADDRDAAVEMYNQCSFYHGDARGCGWRENCNALLPVQTELPGTLSDVQFAWFGRSHVGMEPPVTIPVVQRTFTYMAIPRLGGSAYRCVRFAMLLTGKMFIPSPGPAENISWQGTIERQGSGAFQG